MLAASLRDTESGRTRGLREIWNCLLRDYASRACCISMLIQERPVLYQYTDTMAHRRMPPTFSPAPAMSPAILAAMSDDPKSPVRLTATVACGG